MEKFALGALCFALAFGIYSLFICLIQFAWNSGVASAFDVPTLSFWQIWACMMIIGFVGSCFKVVTKSK